MARGVPTPKEIREQILQRVKNEGITVTEAAKQHGINPNVVYHWLGRKSEGVGSEVIETGKLKRENKELKEMIGKLVMELEKFKKT